MTVSAGGAAAPRGPPHAAEARSPRTSTASATGGWGFLSKGRGDHVAADGTLVTYADYR